MSMIGNVLWFIIGGWWSCIMYGLLGVLFYITIIGIPIGKALFQYAKLIAFPFGKVIVKETIIKGKENVSGIRRVGGLIANILWLPFGIVAFISNIIAGVGCCITIILIPVGIVLFKSAKFLIWPVGAKVIKKEEYQALLNAKYMSTYGNNASAVPSIPQEVPVQRIEAVEETEKEAKEPLSVNTEAIKENLNAISGTVANGLSNAGSALKSTGKMASETAKHYTEQTGIYLKEKYSTDFEQVREGDLHMTWDSTMKQVEAALFRNTAISMVLSFLSWLSISFVVIFALLGLISYHSLLGIVFGISEAAAVVVLCGVLFVVRRKYTYGAICFLGIAFTLFMTIIFGFGKIGIAVIIMRLIQMLVTASFGVVAILLGKDK